MVRRNSPSIHALGMVDLPDKAIVLEKPALGSIDPPSPISAVEEQIVNECGAFHATGAVCHATEQVIFCRYARGGETQTSDHPADDRSGTSGLDYDLRQDGLEAMDALAAAESDRRRRGNLGRSSLRIAAVISRGYKPDHSVLVKPGLKIGSLRGWNQSGFDRIKPVVGHVGSVADAASENDYK